MVGDRRANLFRLLPLLALAGLAGPIPEPIRVSRREPPFPEKEPGPEPDYVATVERTPFLPGPTRAERAQEEIDRKLRCAVVVHKAPSVGRTESSPEAIALLSRAERKPKAERRARRRKRRQKGKR